MSDYGNVPPIDIAAMQNATRIAMRVAGKLHPTVAAEWRLIAYEYALDGILVDWARNGTNELDEDDETDLVNLLRVAQDIAIVQETAFQTYTFKALLKAAMIDWTLNWNADDDDD